MFILIPLVIIFFAYAYLQLNEDLSNFEYIVVYTIIIFTIWFSFKIYKKLKDDSKLQDINSLKQEINVLILRIKQNKDEKQIKLLEKRINIIQKEINDKM